MELNQDTAQAIIDALTILVSEAAIPYLPSLPPAVLDEEEYNRLHELCRILDPNNGDRLQVLSSSEVKSEFTRTWAPANREIDLDTGSESLELRADGRRKRKLIPSPQFGTPNKRRPGRPRNNVKSEPETKFGDSWYKLRDMKEIQLDPSLKEHLTANPDRDAGRFLDACPLKFDPPPQQTVPTLKTLAQLCIPLGTSLPKPATENVRWLFQVLVIGDMIMLLCPSKEQGRPYRLANAMRQSIQDAAGDFGAISRACLDDILTLACSVVFICEHFGTGSLFWLRSNFSKDFLKNKTTKSGTAFNETLANFRQQDFERKIMRSGATALGDAIRAHLRSVYIIDPTGADSEPTGAGSDQIGAGTDPNGNVLHPTRTTLDLIGANSNPSGADPTGAESTKASLDTAMAVVIID